jgi:hypothetical protein
MAALDPEAPPVGEQLHLPDPSLVPIVNAVGVVLTLLGLTLWKGLIVIGLLIFVFSLIRWLRDSAREMRSLPLEHGDH